MENTADALTYTLKSVDPDGFEIHMTNSGKPVKHKDRKKLFDKGGYFDQHEPAQDVGPCAMETVLSTILDSVVKKALVPSSRLDRLMSREVKALASPSSRTESERAAGVVLDRTERQAELRTQSEQLSAAFKQLNR